MQYLRPDYLFDHPDVDLITARLFGPAQMPLNTFGWDTEVARRSVYGYQGPGDEEGQLGPRYKRDLSDRLLPIATERGKTIAARTDEEIRAVLPEAKGVTSVAGMLSTTTAEYGRFTTFVKDRPSRAPWELTEPSRRAMLSRQILLPRRLDTAAPPTRRPRPRERCGGDHVARRARRA